MIYSTYQAPNISQTLSPVSTIEENFQWNSGNKSAPKPLVGKEFYDRVKDIVTIFGKAQKKSSSEIKIWKKRPIFFDLPY